MIGLWSFITLFCSAVDSATLPAYYCYKDAYMVEVIRINDDQSFECYRESNLPHAIPFYSQGYYVGDGRSYTLRPGIVDSLVLSVKERALPTAKDDYFTTSKMKITSGDNLWQLIYFNYDHFNKVQYDKDIRLCVENTYGTKFYKRLNSESMDFGEIVSEGRPAVLYIVSGQYVVTKKYRIKNAGSNYFELAVNKNELFNVFKDFFMANHTLKKKGEQLEDIVNGRVYIPLSSRTHSKNILKIAQSMW
jgi:hypothetical protein